MTFDYLSDKVQDHSHNTKRIAKNSIFLYIRMLVMMAVSLFTFRELLKELGVEDYGTYNAVGGVVILFSFLSNAMTSSNQRFLSFHIGKGDKEQLKQTFSMIINVQLIISLLILFSAETIGLWFLNSQMNFDGEKMFAVNWLYQFTIITFIGHILQIPYTSAIISHERMHFFSLFSIFEALLRLFVVFSLALFDSERLIVYGGLLSLSTFIVLAVYYFYCTKSFECCRYQYIWDKSLFRKLTSFSGWNMLGGLGNIGAGQGINILFNIFCGVSVNAAMGVSHQVSSAVNSVVSNVQTAFNPQIIKSYASGDLAYFKSLIFRSSRLSFCLIAIFGIPIILCMKTILGVWLVDVPNYAIQFTQLIIMFCMVDTISGPLWIANQASGKIRNYMIIISIMILTNLPIAYLILRYGLSPVYVMLARVIVNIAVLVFRLIYLKHSIQFPSIEFIKVVLTRALCLILLVIPLLLCLGLWFNSSLISQILYFTIAIITVALAGGIIMLVPSERQFIIAKCLSILRNHGS